MADEKRYVMSESGTGHAPHSLLAEDGSELSLCSCGGTKDANGLCDGTHVKKKGLGCPCWFCREKENRVNNEFDGESKCG